MKVLVLLLSLTQLVLGDVEAPYPPSGYRPSGPEFTLPERTFNTPTPPNSNNNFNNLEAANNNLKKTGRNFGFTESSNSDQFANVNQISGQSDKNPQSDYTPPPRQPENNFWGKSPQNQYGPPQYPPLDQPLVQQRNNFFTTTPESVTNQANDFEPQTSQSPPSTRSQNRFNQAPIDQYEQPFNNFQNNLPEPRNSFGSPQPEDQFGSTAEPFPKEFTQQPHNQYGPPTTPNSFETPETEFDQQQPLESTTTNVEEFNRDFSRQQQFQRFTHARRVHTISNKGLGNVGQNRYEAVEAEQLRNFNSNNGNKFERLETLDADGDEIGNVPQVPGVQQEEPERKGYPGGRRRPFGRGRFFPKSTTSRPIEGTEDANEEDTVKTAIATAVVHPNSRYVVQPQFGRLQGMIYRPNRDVRKSTGGPFRNFEDTDPYYNINSPIFAF